VAGVGPVALHAADPIADCEAFDARADRHYPARAFRSQGQGQGRRIEAGAIVHVDEVEAHRFGLDQQFAGSGFGEDVVLALDRVGAAVRMHDQAVPLHHAASFGAQAGRKLSARAVFQALA